MNELAYLRLQPYKQTTIKGKGSEKLKPRFYGPYKVIRKVGNVAYELELPMGSKIHNVFHVSCLKKVICQYISVSYTLPPLDDEGQLVLIPYKILKTRERRLRSKKIKEYLVQWKDFPIEEATWERNKFCSIPNWNCLRTRNIGWGGLLCPHHNKTTSKQCSPTY